MFGGSKSRASRGALTVTLWGLVEEPWLVVQVLVDFLDRPGDGCILLAGAQS